MRDKFQIPVKKDSYTREEVLDFLEQQNNFIFKQEIGPLKESADKVKILEKQVEDLNGEIKPYRAEKRANDIKKLLLEKEKLVAHDLYEDAVILARITEEDSDRDAKRKMVEFLDRRPSFKYKEPEVVVEDKTKPSETKASAMLELAQAQTTSTAKKIEPKTVKQDPNAAVFAKVGAASL